MYVLWSEMLRLALLSITVGWASAQFFCPANQVWMQCSRICEPSCQNFYPICDYFTCGPPQCQCYQGYYRQSGAVNAPCIQWEQCYLWGGRGERPRNNWWGIRPRGRGDGGRGRGRGG